MRKFLIPFLFFPSLFSFYDQELEELWHSIPDINHPTLEDYEKIDHYLHEGKRPYLDVLKEDVALRPPYASRLRVILNFSLLSPTVQAPLFEKYTFGASDRCILLYSSANGIYPDKARHALQEIAASGYTGDVLLRIGGYPNIEQGGLKLCHVPYAFKGAFLQEAKNLGYKTVLWLDTAIHPMTSMDSVFEEIEKNGYFLTEVGTLEANRPSHLPQAAESLGLHLRLYPYIHHLSSSMIGLSFENKAACQFLDRWISSIEEVEPNLTWFPEELSLSVAAWWSGFYPIAWFGAKVCNEQEKNYLENRPTVEFYLDGRR